MCMEGIEHNPIVYELMSEMAFRDEKVKVPVLFICSLLVHALKFVFSIMFHILICYVIHVINMLIKKRKRKYGS